MQTHRTRSSWWDPMRLSTDSTAAASTTIHMVSRNFRRIIGTIIVAFLPFTHDIVHVQSLEDLQKIKKQRVNQSPLFWFAFARSLRCNLHSRSPSAAEQNNSTEYGIWTKNMSVPFRKWRCNLGIWIRDIISDNMNGVRIHLQNAF